MNLQKIEVMTRSFTGDLNCRLNFFLLKSHLPRLQYEPEIFCTAYAKFDRVHLNLFSSGKDTITGVKEENVPSRVIDFLQEFILIRKHQQFTSL